MKDKIKNHKIIFSLHLKLSLFLSALVLCASLFIIKINNNLINHQNESTLELEMKAIKAELDNSIAQYNSMLHLLKKQINKEQEIFNEENKASSAIKELYLAPKPSFNEHHITFTDIIWYNKEHGFAVNKYGSISLSKDLTDVRDVEENKYPILEKANKSNNYNELYLNLYIFNHLNKNTGKIILKLNFLQWLESIKTRLNHLDYALFLVNKPNNEIIFSTIKNLPSDLKFNIEKDKKFLNYMFSKTSEIKHQPFYLALGYSQKTYHNLLLNKNVIPLAALLFCFIICISAIYLFRHILKQELSDSLKEKVNHLTKENKTYELNQVDLLAKNCTQTDKHKQEIIYYKQLTQLYEQSIRTKHSLESAIFNKMAESLNQIKESIWILVKAVEGKKDFSSYLSKQTLILDKLYNNVTELGYCLTHSTPTSVNLRNLINETLLIYSKEIFLLKISTNINIHSDASNITIDDILLRQLLANLFRETISYSRKNGNIEILAEIESTKKQKYLVITIKDDGFGITSEPNNIEYCALLPLEMDIEILSQFIISLEGDLS